MLREERTAAERKNVAQQPAAGGESRKRDSFLLGKKGELKGMEENRSKEERSREENGTKEEKGKIRSGVWKEKGEWGTKGEKQEGEEQTREEKEKHREERIEQTGQVTLNENRRPGAIHLLSIIGEIEGHDNLSGNAKTTKYEHILPSLAAIEDSEEIQGVLVLLNTMGGDVEAGLAIAEMLASLSKPVVSLVLGGSHSIGVPIAVSTDYSFIVPTGTMVIHPVRMNGMVIGVPQTFEYFKLIQDRITGFVCNHCKISKKMLEELMMETGILTKDVGTILVGEEAVRYGIIDEVGGIDRALGKLRQMIEERKYGDDKSV